MVYIVYASGCALSAALCGRAGQYMGPYSCCSFFQRTAERISVRAYMIAYDSFRSFVARCIVLLGAGESVYMRAYVVSYGPFEHAAQRASIRAYTVIAPSGHLLCAALRRQTPASQYMGLYSSLWFPLTCRRPREA